MPEFVEESLGEVINNHITKVEEIFGGLIADIEGGLQKVTAKDVALVEKNPEFADRVEALVKSSVKNLELLQDLAKPLFAEAEMEKGA